MTISPGLRTLAALLLTIFVLAGARAAAQEIPLVKDWKFAADPDNRGREKGFEKAGFDDSKWATIQAGESWEAQGFEALDGFAWYRRKFTLAEAPAEDALLELGTIDDVDEIYVNGSRVGGTGEFPPATRSAWNRTRVYTIAHELLTKGDNTIAIRVFDEGGDGGLRSGLHRLIIGPATRELLNLRLRRPTGFAAANFAFAMELATDGEFPARIWANAPAPGVWFEECATARLSFREGAVEVGAPEMLINQAQRQWPFVSARYASTKIDKIIFDLEAFCPVVRTPSPWATAMPVGLAKFIVKNVSDSERNIEICWRLALDGEVRSAAADQRDNIVYSGLDSARFSIRTDGATGTSTGDIVRLWTIKIKIAPNETKEVRVCFAQSPRGSTGSIDAGDWPDSSDLAVLGLRNFDVAYKQTLEIDHWIPRTGDPQIDQAFRWYCANAIQLTKASTNNNISVMGYSEMTQRDAYWGAFIHNLLFPELERRMIEEVFTEQQADGKIPTSILPTVDRKEDLDTNSYAVLRAFRYAKWNHDIRFLTSIAANLKGAVLWLGSRDTDNDALPDGRSAWTDWKDALAFAERKYSPHALLLYIAALGEVRDIMKLGKDNAATIAEIESRRTRAIQAINAPFANGGLWNGKFYSERWREGPESMPAEMRATRNVNIINEDQVVGILLGVVEDEKVNLIFDSLSANRTRFGNRESFPARPASLGYRDGDYFNGGIFPWLNYVDAWARLRAGRVAEGIELLRLVSWLDLQAPEGAVPSECIDAITGRPMRNSPQLWNSSFVGAVYHGIFGIERDLNGLLHIEPRAKLASGWRVRVTIPEGEIEARDGENGGPPVLEWSLKDELPISVKLTEQAAWRQVLQPGNGKKIFDNK